MTILEAINKEIDGLVEYMLMLGDVSGRPADFIAEKNGKRYALMLREIPPEDGDTNPEQEVEQGAE